MAFPNALTPHPEELGEAGRLEGWERVKTSGAWFETALRASSP
jgi:hypothetical protein